MLADATISILNAADSLRDFQRTSPVDLNTIADHLQVNVWEFHDLPADISGKIFRDPLHGGKSGYSIGVNSREPYTRKRFTIAHELAHLMLHRDLIGDGIVDDALYRSKLSSQIETEANKLAADILMPLHLIRNLQQHGTRTADSLADALEVSLTAMKIRLGIPV